MRAALEQQLEQWLLTAGAETARLVLCPNQEGACPCATLVELPAEGCAAWVVEGACALQRECPVLAEAGAGEPSLLLCLRSPLSSDQAFALQTGFVDGSGRRGDPGRFTHLAGPLLMTVKSTLREHAMEHWLQSMADYAPPAPPDLMDSQAQVYARELRRLFFQTSQLTLQTAAVQERLQAEVRQAMAAQDEEREWIALEVHDRIAQTLASVFQQLQTLEGLARSYPELRQAAVRGSLLCREVIKEARNIMNDLQPPVLEDLGLVPALEEELRELAEKVPCRVKQTLSLAGRLPRGIEMALYRIFREALVNIQRHASATEVRVTLHQEGGGVRLGISDNGHGFHVQDAMERKRVGGLLSMRRRAQAAGGTWQIQSEPGRGTKITAWLPVLTPSREAGAREAVRP